MLSGLPLLTLEEHEFYIGPPGACADMQGSWALIAVVSGGPCTDVPPGHWYTGSDPAFIWARRRDGRPLACSYFGAEDLRAEIQRQAEEILELRERLASTKERLALVRKGQAK